MSPKQWVVQGTGEFRKVLKFVDDKEIPDPEKKAKKLGPYEVLVKVKAVSLNYRDLLIAKGTYAMPVVDNVVPGSDASAKVLAVGSSVTEFKPGDRVATQFTQAHQYGAIEPNDVSTTLGGAINGVLREYAVFPETGLVKIPDSLSWEEGATLSCAAVTAWNAFYGLKPLKQGDYVLVQGTGGVSIFALQFAKAAGAFVVATTSSSSKANTLRHLGADHVINYNETPDWGEQAKALTPAGLGFDHVIEVGGPATLKQSFKAVKFEGLISIIGFLAGPDAKDEESRAGFIDVLYSAANLRGVLIGSRRQMKDMCRAIEVNKIKPVVDKKVFGWEELTEAYKYQWEQKHFGKLVVVVDSSN